MNTLQGKAVNYAKEIHYGNGVKLVFNETTGVWEARRDSRVKQQPLGSEPLNVPQTPVRQMGATFTLTPLENHPPVKKNVTLDVEKDDDSDGDIEVIYESKKPVSKPQPLVFTNLSRNVTLKQLANDVYPITRRVDDEIEVEVLGNTSPVFNHQSGLKAHYPDSRPNYVTERQPVVNNVTYIRDLKERLKNQNVTLTRQSSDDYSGNIIVQTQDIPVKPRALSVKPRVVVTSVQPPLQVTKLSNIKQPVISSTSSIHYRNINVSNLPLIQQLQARKPTIELRKPFFEIKKRSEDEMNKPLSYEVKKPFSCEVKKPINYENNKKPVVKFKKCTETHLVCVVCKSVFLNPGDAELDSRLHGRFSCGKCNQFLVDCCNGIFDIDSFQCTNGENCDISGDERCYYCWFEKAFIVLNVDVVEAQKTKRKL